MLIPSCKRREIVLISPLLAALNKSSASGIGGLSTTGLAVALGVTLVGIFYLFFAGLACLSSR